MIQRKFQSDSHGHFPIVPQTTEHSLSLSLSLSLCYFTLLDLSSTKNLSEIMAAVVVLCLVTFLAMAGHSTATYCICKDGLSDSVLQKDIDYACANGADCSHILQNGSCYNPVTVKDHCNYAVNSYYQRKNQVSGSCDFSGTATTTQAVPNQSSGCVYPSSPSTAGNTSTTPTLGPSTSPSTPSTGTTPSTTTPSIFGLGPTTGSGSTTNVDNKATVTTLHQKTLLFWSLTLTLLLSGPLFARA